MTGYVAKVIERDGFQCTRPGCSSRSGLQGSHIESRAQGGSDDASNIHTRLCRLSPRDRARHSQGKWHGPGTTSRGKVPSGSSSRRSRTRRRIPPKPLRVRKSASPVSRTRLLAARFQAPMFHVGQSVETRPSDHGSRARRSPVFKPEIGFMTARHLSVANSKIRSPAPLGMLLIPVCQSCCGDSFLDCDRVAALCDPSGGA